MVGDMPFAVDRFTLPALSTPGFPVELMKAAAIKQRAPHLENVPLWVNRFRAWLAVDPERARLSLPVEAAAQLEQAGAIPGEWIPPVLGGDATYGLMETAQIRILRATGHIEAADRMATELLEPMRI